MTATVQNIRERSNVTVLGKGVQVLLFSHGFGTDQNAWRHQTGEFADRYSIVLFDHVGAGRNSEKFYNPRRYNSLYTFANDLLEICAALSLKDVTIVGHSVGAMIGLLACTLAPEYFSKLVMIGASPRYLNDADYTGGFTQEGLDGHYAMVQENYGAWVGGFAAAAMGNPGRPDLTHGFAASLLALRPDIALSTMKVIFQSDHRADLAKLSIPAWVLQSTKDIAVPMSVGAYLHENIAGSRYIELEAEGHFPHLSAPDAVNREIAKALSVP
jgi:sigma-B regulation protein RsbQ